MEGYGKFNSVCRLCLSDNVPCVSIFDDNHRHLAQRIASCVNVEVLETDKMTTLICTLCVQKVEDLHNFRKSCEEAQLKLHDWVTALFGDKFNDSSFVVKDEILDENEILEVPDSSMIHIKSEPLSVPEDEDDEEMFDLQDTDMEQNDEEIRPPTLSPQYPNLNRSESSESLLIPTDLVPEYNDEDALNGLYKKSKTDYYVNTSLRCSKCPKTFTNSANRSRHEKMAHAMSMQNEELYNGDVTIQQFAACLQLVQNGPKKVVSEEEFIEYNKKMSRVMQTRVCHCCEKYFSSVKSLVAHMKKKGTLELRTCFTCGISFPAMGQFMKHRSTLCRRRAKIRKTERLKFHEHYKCGSCNYIFEVPNSYVNHVQKYHQPIMLPNNCVHCGVRLLNQADFRAHCSSLCGLKVYCAICKSDFKTKEDFLNHNIIHSDRDRQAAPANYNGTTNDGQQQVRRASPQPSASNSEEQRAFCPDCPNSYSNFHNLLRHMKNIHKTRKYLNCQFCPLRPSSTFLSRSDLDKHLASCHASNIKNMNYSCGICGILSESESEWNLHRKTHEESENGNLKMKLFRVNSDSYRTAFAPLSCNVCSQSFLSEQEFEQHKLIHLQMPVLTSADDDENKPQHRCHICNRSFFAYSSLYRHRRTQHKQAMHKIPPIKIGDKRQCPICLMFVKNSKAMWYHKKRFHSDRGVIVKKEKAMPVLQKMDMNDAKKKKKLYKCVECNLIFDHPVGLSNHTRSHKHKPEGSTKVTCHICSKQFGSLAARTRHMVVHMKKESSPSPLEAASSQQENEDPKKLERCEICNKTFQNKAGRSSHMRRHQRLSNTLLQCDMCNKQFLTMESLVQHSKVHVQMKFDRKKPAVSQAAADEEDFYCRACDKHFPHLHSLKTHLGWHNRKLRLGMPLQPVHVDKTKVKKCYCKPCKMSFPNYQALMQHKSSHEVPFCNVCNRSFAYVGSYRNHMRLAHGPENGEEPPLTIKMKQEPGVLQQDEIAVRKGYSCTQCGDSFDNAKALRQHVSTHV